MHRLFYSKLAMTNIKKNAKFYIPYILACIGSIMLFYVMGMISRHPDLDKLRGAESIRSMMQMGSYIIGIFSIIFLFYTNQFLIKRRKKELGLYNILGMEKRHIAKILFRETLFIAVIALVFGILGGILFSRLIILLFQKVLDYSVVFSQQISVGSVITSLILFGAIFLLCLLFNLAKIKLANPIELLKGGNVGEKEPKTKVLLAIIGFACIGGGYYIALTVQSPLEALTLFFIAVLLVIIGTYCIFTAGSIFILKLLRKKKKFYYQTKHFTAVAGMIYRMKQNALGLANICILCTMVLVMVSGTVCLYLGVEDAINVRFESDIMIKDSYKEYKQEDFDAIEASAKASIAKSKTKLDGIKYFHCLSIFAILEGNQLSLPEASLAQASRADEFIFVSLEEYNRLTNQNISLQENEVLSYDTKHLLDDDIEVFEKTYFIKDELTKFPFESENSNFVSGVVYLVVPNSSVITWIWEQQKSVYQEQASLISYRLLIDLEGKEMDKLDTYKLIKTDLDQLSKDSLEHGGSKNKIYCDSKQEMREEAGSLFGGFLFLGSFLGIVFIMATVLIMYYKQISEGYEDKERFAIMQKVGMSRSEVKKSIRSQVLMVFFAPLLMATMHVIAAFSIIKKLLAVLYLTNVSLYIACLSGTVIIFAIIYTVVYVATARTYSKIVG